MSTQTHHQTRYIPSGYCIHGQRPCYGNPDRQVEPCPSSAHTYCPHGVDSRKLTSDGESRCPYCRGAKRRVITP